MVSPGESSIRAPVRPCRVDLTRRVRADSCEKSRIGLADERMGGCMGVYIQLQWQCHLAGHVHKDQDLRMPPTR